MGPTLYGILEQEKSKPPAGCFLSLFAVCVAIPACLACFAYSWSAANRDFERLLGGDRCTSIQRIDISVPNGRAVRIDDPTLLEYLSEMFRHAEPHEGECGISYQVEFRLSTGRRITCGIEIPRSSDEITIGFPFYTMGDPVLYGVPLRRPIPKELDEVFFELGCGERARANAANEIKVEKRR